MPRVLLPVAAMILTAMALALLACSILLPFRGPAARPAVNVPAVVERFNASVKTTIATGDTAELLRVAVPNFVAEQSLPGAGPGHGQSLASNRDPAAFGRSTISLTTQPFSAREWLFIAGMSIRHHPPRNPAR